VEWFTTERANLLTAIEQACEQELWAMAWELTDSLASFLDRRGYWNDRRRASELALEAARRAGDRRWQAKMLYHLGSVRSDQACWDEALGIFEQARTRGVREYVHTARRWYSWSSPPSRSRRRTVPGWRSRATCRPAGGSGGRSSSARCGRWAL